MTKAWGYELIMNLSDCDRNIMQSKELLEQYVVKLCKLIDMKRYGNCIIEYFGTNKTTTAGFSLVQLIETSSITGHFADDSRQIFLNVFSCKPFKKAKAVEFTRIFFGAKKVTHKFIER
jgi:S-adenosylmethionine/arginine decarboxylase-like enzyme